MATPPEQAPDTVASTSTTTGETDDETDDETIDETDNELLSAYVDVSSDYESDNDETDNASVAAMKFAKSTTAFHAKSTDIATANANFSALKLYAALESSSKTNPWQPNVSEYEETTPMCRMRVKRDITDLLTDPPPGVHVVPAEHNITVMNALVLGPDDTPYEGGFFHFVIQCPPDYPTNPPRVRFMTTDYGGVRFNPNLYECGKVCLSILGTWTGPAWSPAQSIASVLISIQSLLSENPYHNEPDHETEWRPGDSKRYNLIVQHETIRVAVCDAIEACLNGCSICPPPLRDVMLKTFPDYYDKYEAVIVSNEHLTGRSMEDPFGTRRGQFQYKTLLKRLQALKGRVQDWLKATRERSE
ncbi:ubiquitin-conjugating enzyme E2 Z [Rhipicephalus microplus]|uniref:ubiquitin-conjugating enzyme E2 Z n=1 Tax=Rhipicephalus microplus TaxID=6941 RepID=UPI003F6D5A8B